MIVYVVKGFDYEGSEILGVYSIDSWAKQKMEKAQETGDWGSVTIDECEVDPSEEEVD